MKSCAWAAEAPHETNRRAPQEQRAAHAQVQGWGAGLEVETETDEADQQAASAVVVSRRPDQSNQEGRPGLVQGLLHGWILVRARDHTRRDWKKLTVPVGARDHAHQRHRELLLLVQKPAQVSWRKTSRPE